MTIQPITSRSLRRALAAVTLSVAVTACTVGPWYHKPEIASPGAWQVPATAVPATDTSVTPTNGVPQPAIAQPPASEPASPIAWPSSDWWRGFNSPQLNDLMEQAQRANDDIAAAVARVREADAQVKIAGAPLFPSLGLEGDADRQRTLSGRGAPGSIATTGNQYTAQLSASYELDFWGKNLSTRRAAKFAADASRYDRATVELTVMTSVASTYFQAVQLHDRLAVAEQNLATAQQILKGLELRASVGTVNALDVAQEETTVAIVSASIPPLRLQFQQLVNALAILVGRAPQDLQFPGGDLTELAEPAVAPGIPSELLARRPDVAEAEAELMAANADIGAARAAFFPSIGLTVAGGYESTELASLFMPASRLFAISGSLAQQIFAGGALRGRYSLSKARYSELLADYHKSVISAFGDVENSLVALQQTTEEYKREQYVVAKAQHAYELTDTLLRAGTVDVLTVLSTQTALFNAQDALVQVRFAHLEALVRLFGALGGGWQKN